MAAQDGEEEDEEDERDGAQHLVPGDEAGDGVPGPEGEAEKERSEKRSRQNQRPSAERGRAAKCGGGAHRLAQWGGRRPPEPGARRRG